MLLNKKSCKDYRVLIPISKSIFKQLCLDWKIQKTKPNKTSGSLQYFNLVFLFVCTMSSFNCLITCFGVFFFCKILPHLIHGIGSIWVDLMSSCLISSSLLFKECAPCCIFCIPVKPDSEDRITRFFLDCALNNHCSCACVLCKKMWKSFFLWGNFCHHKVYCC